uniref:Uncharacterized protein n=1 Tax=Anguilla anguilla TaxID=7936 RepID=A0A0E9WS28_ANGAN
MIMLWFTAMYNLDILDRFGDTGDTAYFLIHRSLVVMRIHP